LPELKLHFRTLGTSKRNAAGKITNGVLLLQDNTGTGANWLRPSLADALFGPGQPLDARQGTARAQTGDDCGTCHWKLTAIYHLTSQNGSLRTEPSMNYGLDSPCA
jgi:hypothetical protein